MKTAVRHSGSLMEKGYNALATALGPDGLVNFIQRLSDGSGDYTKDRNKWLDKLSEAEVLKNIKNRSSRRK